MKHINSVLTLALLFASSSLTYSQPKYPTLKRLLSEYKYDSILIVGNSLLEREGENYILLGYLGEAYLDTYQAERCFEISNRALEIAPDTAHHFRSARYLDMAYCYSDLGQNLKSLELCRRAMWEKPVQSSEVYANAIFHLAFIYRQLKNYDSALYYADKVHDLDFARNDSSALASDCNALGILYAEKKDFKKALSYYHQAFTYIDSTKKTQSVPRYLNNIGTSYEGLGQLDSARWYIRKSLKKYEELGDSLGMAKRWHNLGSIEAKYGKEEIAYQYYKKALGLAGSKLFAIRMNVAIGAILRKMGKTELSIKYLNDAIDHAGLVNNMEDLLLARTELSLSLEQSKRYKQALGELKTVIEYRDSLRLNKAFDQLSEIDLEFKMSQKRKEIELINKNHELEIEKAYREKLFVLVVSVLVVVFGIVFFIQYRNKNALSKRLLNEEIDGLRLRIGKIMSDIKLEEVTIDADKLQNNLPNTLTEREVQILQVAITNKTNSEIADEVHLSVNTVKYHLKNIYNKLGVSTRLEAREALSQIN